ncbi:hypothetical protein LEM8419_02507 [Neolewinella maritima]|uniref:Uncharacterized protein n=1 Tax=Neolewinella maritima TaxID=1383882 RepID=A0ABM9B2N5_9BACT|nr:hypothetical protein [Neolewinella maritima]CAH1001602.1 hypothetical protein LEM8419_02507 [Neolewinella maritima]
MSKDELLDDWPTGKQGKQPKHTPRPDPIGMLFDGIPEPVIMSDEEELPILRPFSPQLILELIGWLLGVTAAIYGIYRLCLYFGWWGL